MKNTDNESRRGILSNLAVIRGVVTHDLVMRDLPSGAEVAQFDVSTLVEAGHRTATVSVPIAWHDPTAAARSAIAAGAEVLVVGSVRRRFFRVGAATQSRTEVVAEAVIPMRRRKQVAAALIAVGEKLVGSEAAIR